jgi:hypothetical protein
MLNRIDRKYFRHKSEIFHQGDILKDIEIVLHAEETKEGNIGSTENLNLEYTVVMTQECDLEQDYKNRIDKTPITQDKYLKSVLLVPAYLAYKLKNGEHIKGFKMEKYGSHVWRAILKNHQYRYHYLSTDLEYQIPELIIDFKHYYTIYRDVLYNMYKNEENYVATISPLFREEISIRFAQYIARIGTPDLPAVNQQAKP